MLTEIRLENFKSFGRLQTIPLEPITLLVGPNNSGKSNFLSVARFMRNATVGGAETAVVTEGGRDFVFHRPRHGAGELSVGWRTLVGEYETRVGLGVAPNGLQSMWEAMKHEDPQKPKSGWLPAWSWDQGRPKFFYTQSWPSGAFGALRHVRNEGAHAGVWQPLLEARLVRLELDALRADAPVVEAPELTTQGGGLPAVLGLWRGANPPRAQELDNFLASCVPEVRHVLVKPAPTPGHQRLWFSQSDGQEFDASHASDGLLCFTALAAHVIGAPPGTVFMVEEPEQGIHPRRLRYIGDLMRQAVRERDCQFIVATHSSVLLDVFRDEPERILLFRRGNDGTEVRRCTDVPEVVAALEVAPPGELLETAFFEGAWDGTAAT